MERTAAPGLQALEETATVIVPVYRDGERLEACLQCLARQSWPAEALQVLVVDNGNDPAVDVLSTRFPDVTVLREPRPGSYAARNRGLAAARGTWIAFTDADCLPAPDWIERGVERLRNVGRPAVAAGRVELTFRDPRRPRLVELYESVIAFRQQVYAERESFGATANLLTHRQVLETVGGFDDRLKSGGDREWGQRAAAAGFPVVYAPRAVVRHPARWTTSQLVARAARIAGGRHQYFRDRRTPLAGVGRDLARRTRREGAAGLLRRLWQAARWRLAATGRLVFPLWALREIWTARHLGPAQRLGVSGLLFLTRWVMLAERVRLAAGGRPRRS